MPPGTPDLADMLSAYPVRTALLSVLPLVLAGTLTLNAAVHQVSLPAVGAFSLVLLAFAASATRQSLAAYRTETLEADLFE